MRTLLEGGGTYFLRVCFLLYIIWSRKRKKKSIFRAFMAGAASQAPGADSSRAPGLTSGLKGSVNVYRGALLLMPQWQCISSFVFYSYNINLQQSWARSRFFSFTFGYNCKKKTSNKTYSVRVAIYPKKLEPTQTSVFVFSKDTHIACINMEDWPLTWDRITI